MSHLKKTHSHVAFPPQEWLHERTPLLRYMYIACIVTFLSNVANITRWTHLSSLTEPLWFWSSRQSNFCTGCHPVQLDTQILSCTHQQIRCWMCTVRLSTEDRVYTMSGLHDISWVHCNIAHSSSNSSERFDTAARKFTASTANANRLWITRIMLSNCNAFYLIQIPFWKQVTNGRGEGKAIPVQAVRVLEGWGS